MGLKFLELVLLTANTSHFCFVSVAEALKPATSAHKSLGGLEVRVGVAAELGEGVRVRVGALVLYVVICS